MSTGQSLEDYVTRYLQNEEGFDIEALYPAHAGNRGVITVQQFKYVHDISLDGKAVPDFDFFGYSEWQRALTNTLAADTAAAAQLDITNGQTHHRPAGPPTAEPLRTPAATVIEAHLLIGCPFKLRWPLENHSPSCRCRHFPTIARLKEHIGSVHREELAALPSDRQQFMKNRMKGKELGEKWEIICRAFWPGISVGQDMPPPHSALADLLRPRELGNTHETLMHVYQRIHESIHNMHFLTTDMKGLIDQEVCAIVMDEASALGGTQ
ncbi:hypothetical protein MPH_12677 [Macrophomina phaseolina MS6]|uniref:Uncharacterized protein n=1 Tax=Macrophomina phaseolina (strain MS6) TaxID=1126212 RepID=K2RBI0_MACPH|nr:hypothetical protein MPH_12677 [Macrophomina phaseolina MS6]